jgi:hypothetical protein
MRLQENALVQQQDCAAIGRPAEQVLGPRDGSMGAQGRGQPYLPFRLQRDFQPCDNCSSTPPLSSFAHLPLSQLPIRLSILPVQMTREGELQAIRAVDSWVSF